MIFSDIFQILKLITELLEHLFIWCSGTLYVGLYLPEKQLEEEMEEIGPGAPSGLELIFISGQADIIIYWITAKISLKISLLKSEIFLP